MITYNSRLGVLILDGKQYPAYSGFGQGKNNPAMETVPDVGPIPVGDWVISRWDDQHGEKGPQVAVLRPLEHDAHGRSAFLIHGDSASHPGAASHGCIITSRDVRNKLRASDELHLKVIATGGLTS